MNSGYGANQKTCYRLALEAQADIVIMVHPDYQYTPRLIPAMVSMIGSGLYPCVLASRVLGRHAMKGGMPVWKYIFNRCLTLAENYILGASFPSTTRAIGPSRGNSWSGCNWTPAPTILSSTTRCLRRSSGWARSSPR